jgi:3-dehydroquinate dehydratase-1
MKIVVPIMPKNLSEIAKLDTAQYANADLVEWRADFMPIPDLKQAAQDIKAQFPNQEIIFTYRTEDKAEPIISAKITLESFINFRLNLLTLMLKY